MRLSTFRQYPWPLVHSSVNLFNVTEWLFWGFIVCCMCSSNMIRISRAKQQSVTINVLSSIIHRTAIKWILQTGSVFLAACSIYYVSILGLCHATFTYPTRLDYSSHETCFDLLNKQSIFLSLWTVQVIEGLAFHPKKFNDPRRLNHKNNTGENELSFSRASSDCWFRDALENRKGLKNKRCRLEQLEAISWNPNSQCLPIKHPSLEKYSPMLSSLSLVLKKAHS